MMGSPFFWSGAVTDSVSRVSNNGTWAAGHPLDAGLRAVGRGAPGRDAGDIQSLPRPGFKPLALRRCCGTRVDTTSCG